MKIKIVTNIGITLLSALIPYGIVIAQGFSINANDTIAGKETQVYGYITDLGKSIEIDMIKPDGSIIELFTNSDNNGKFTLKISGYHTKTIGEYIITGKTNNLSKSNSKFKVFSGKMSEIKSYMEISKDSLSAISDILNITVSINDIYGNPIRDHKVKLLSSRFDDKFIDEASTNEFGKAEFEIKSNKEGVSIFTSIDITENKTLNSRTKVIFYSPEEKYAIGGNDYSASLIGNKGGLMQKYSDNFGKIDSFAIETNDNVVVNSPENYMKIKAIDSNGKTVKDYHGTILIEVPEDPNIILPGDGTYTFKNEDQGEKTFNLSQTFNKEGKITINVYDYLDGKINERIMGSKILNIEKKEIQTQAPSGQDSPALKITHPTNGTKIGNNQITLLGTSLPFIGLKVYINDKIQNEEIESGADGNFNITIKGLKDGSNKIHVTEKEGQRRSSEDIEIIIDTTPPSIDKVDIFPEQGIVSESSFNINVFTEKNLASLKVIINGSMETLNEKKGEPGSYEANIIAPSDPGEYWIDVMLTDGLGNKGTYNKIKSFSVTKKISLPPSKITNITSTPNTTSTRLKWDTPNSQNPINKYKIYFGNSQNSIELFQDTSINDITIDNLKENNKYYLQISSIDTDGNESEKSDIQEINTLEPVHPSPETGSVAEDLLVARGGDSIISLQWKALGNQVSKYKIYYGIEQKFLEASIITNNTNTTYTLEDMINKLPYFVQVVGIDDKGNEITEKSNIATATPTGNGFVKKGGSIDIGGLITGGKWQNPKTGSGIWFISAIMLILIDLIIKIVWRNSNNGATY